MKIGFWVKKSDFEIFVGTGRNDDIWSEMSPWDALDMIWAQNWYLNYSRVDFGKIEKNRFFDFWNVGFRHILAGILDFRPNIGRIMAGTPQPSLKLFQKKMAHIRSEYLRNPIKICDFGPKSENGNIAQSVAFVVFVAFLGTTMLTFQKFKIWRYC